MNEVIAVPTVEQINLEHQLANNKAAEAVQHATNCGLMLLQVKASKQHGDWLPWLNGEIESGRLKVKIRQAQSYMQLASNTQRAAYLEAPSIRAALELLSEKEPDEQQGTLIDVESERKAREAAEANAESERQARLIAEQRSKEWNEQYIKERDEKRAVEQKVLNLESQPKPEPERVEVAPEDYESTKKKASELQSQYNALQKQLDSLQKQQAKLVKEQVAAKLSERQVELDKLEADKKAIEEVVARKKAYLDSLDSEVKRIETHRSVIDGSRLELISLASFLNDLDPMNDRDTIKRWLALAEMHQAASDSIKIAFGDSRKAINEQSSNG